MKISTIQYFSVQVGFFVGHEDSKVGVLFCKFAGVYVEFFF